MRRRQFLVNSASIALIAMSPAAIAQSYDTRAWLSISQDGIAIISSPSAPFPAWDIPQFSCEIVSYGFNTPNLTVAVSARYDSKNRRFTRKAGGNRTEVLVPGETILICDHYSEEYTLVYSVSSGRFLFARLGGKKRKVISYAKYMAYSSAYTSDIYFVRRAETPLKMRLGTPATVSMPQGRIVQELELGIESDGTNMVLVKCLDGEDCSTPMGWVRRADLEHFKLEPIPLGPLPRYDVKPARSIKGCGHEQQRTTWEQIAQTLYLGLDIGTVIGGNAGGQVTRNSGSNEVLTLPRNLQVEATIFVRTVYVEGNEGMFFNKSPAWVEESKTTYILQESTVNCDSPQPIDSNLLSEGFNAPGPSYDKRPLNSSDDVSNFVRRLSNDMRDTMPEEAIRFIVAEMATRGEMR